MEFNPCIIGCTNVFSGFFDGAGGWVLLSDNIYVYNIELITTHTMYISMSTIKGSKTDFHSIEL